MQPIDPDGNVYLKSITSQDGKACTPPDGGQIDIDGDLTVADYCSKNLPIQEKVCRPATSNLAQGTLTIDSEGNAWACTDVPANEPLSAPKRPAAQVYKPAPKPSHEQCPSNVQVYGQGATVMNGMIGDRPANSSSFVCRGR